MKPRHDKESWELGDRYREIRVTESHTDAEDEPSVIESSESKTGQVLSRRDLLKSAGIVSAAAALPLPVLASMEAQPQAAAPAPEPTRPY